MTPLRSSTIRPSVGLWPLVGGGESTGPLNSSKETAVHGRPLVGLSFAANYCFGRLDPFGYHLVNIIIHLLATVCAVEDCSRETLRLDYFQGRFDRSAEAIVICRRTCLGRCTR